MFIDKNPVANDSNLFSYASIIFRSNENLYIDVVPDFSKKNFNIEITDKTFVLNNKTSLFASADIKFDISIVT